MGNVNFQYRSKKDVANIEIRFTFKDSNDKFKSYYTRTNFEVSKEFWNEYKSNTRFRDVEKAMQEGFSTASEEVRQMGFGAGMGLPNIKKNCDEMLLSSLPGTGTRLEIKVLF
jgi:hypothetical protein